MKVFSKFINISLKMLYLVIIYRVVKFIMINDKGDVSFSLILLSLAGLLGLMLYMGIKKEVPFGYLFCGILFVGFILRILWFLNMDNLPVSDFGIMFQAGGDFSRGALYMFQGNNYFARFPHMSMTVMYFGLLQSLFSDPIKMVRLLNLVFSMFNLLLIYLIARQIFQDRDKSLGAMFLAGIYPPMIYYDNVFASENLAMPILLLSVLFFLKAMDKGKIKGFIVAGIFLGIAHLFRPVGYVVLPAYLMYAVIYYRKSLKEKLLTISSLLLTSITPIVLVSLILLNSGIIQYPLWQGTEPLSVSLLKGTNISASGTWNDEDAALFENMEGDYESIDKECRRVIKERFQENTLTQWLSFFVNKFGSQWMRGDFAGAYWAEDGVGDQWAQSLFANDLHRGEKLIISMKSQGLFFSQVFWLSLLALTYLGFYHKTVSENNKLQLLYILFCGFALLYLITETQPRYGYIAAWLFPLLAVVPFNKSKGVNGII